MRKKLMYGVMAIAMMASILTACSESKKNSLVKRLLLSFHGTQEGQMI